MKEKGSEGGSDAYMHTSDQNAVFPQMSSTNLVSHCMPAALFQSLPCSCVTAGAAEPVPEPVPALTSTEHCILFNHFGDISIRVDAEVTGALERWKTKGI